jgi:cytochrome c-type biogenesis protein CcmH/NrfF
MTNAKRLVNRTPKSVARQEAAHQRTASAVPSRSEISRASAPEVRLLKRIAFALALLVFASAPLLTAQVGYSQHAKQIGTHLKCMCRGCDMSAGLCAHPGGSFSGPCDTAKSMLKEVDQHLAEGESEQQIIDGFVAEYGTIVYMEPPKKGFGLVAWLMPVFYVVVGLAILVFIVRKWALRPSTLTHGRAGHAAAASDANDPLARARAQAARETED